MQDAPEGSKSGRLVELALAFLRLGATAFGGPAAHVAMMEEEFVRRRRWLDHATFLDMFGATNLIPGPSSTELALMVGLFRAGHLGLLVAGASFIAPAAAFTTFLAWSYGRYGTLPLAVAITKGLSPVVVAIVVQALLALAPKAAKTNALRVVGVAAAVAIVAGAPELAVLAGAGLVGILLARPPAKDPGASLLLFGAVKAGATTAATPTGVFLVFFKIGSVIFGSGYVLLAFLRADLVTRLGWIDERVVLDAVAAGQVTPGPVFTTATFIGYLIGGVPSAIAATAGIFLPGFLIIALSGTLVPKLRRSRAAGGFLDGVNVASLALMVIVATQLGRAAIVDAVSGLLFFAALVALLRFRVQATWLVLAGALVGAVRAFV